MYDIHVVTQMFFFLFICYPQKSLFCLNHRNYNCFIGYEVYTNGWNTKLYCAYVSIRMLKYYHRVDTILSTSTFNLHIINSLAIILYTPTPSMCSIKAFYL